MSVVKVRNTQKFQRWFKKNTPTASKIINYDYKNNIQYVIIDLNYYGTSMGNEIEASKKIRTIVSDFKGKKVK
ncbi:hypothetical protein PBI_SCTP2_368 [Salicola phage SCTP-2]|nr:hypothetical protein PBI_SCTP2_368 [Salicola phage SCTP-2]